MVADRCTNLRVLHQAREGARSTRARLGEPSALRSRIHTYAKHHWRLEFGSARPVDMHEPAAHKRTGGAAQHLGPEAPGTEAGIERSFDGPHKGAARTCQLCIEHCQPPASEWDPRHRSCASVCTWRRPYLISPYCATMASAMKLAATSDKRKPATKKAPPPGNTKAETMCSE